MAQEHTMGGVNEQEGEFDLELSGGELEMDFGDDSLFGSGGLDLGEGEDTSFDFGEPLGEVLDPDIDDLDSDELKLTIQADGFDFDDEGVFGTADISKIANEYYKNILAIMERMQPTQVRSDDKFTLNRSDFPYLDSRGTSALSKLILAKAEEQRNLPESRRLSSEEAAEEIFEQFSELIPNTSSGKYDEFIDTTATIFENFFKRASATSAKVKPKFDTLVDKKKLQEAWLTCYLNGYLWNQVTVLFSDPNVNYDLPVNQPSQGKYNVSVIGLAMDAYNQHLKEQGQPAVTVRNMTTGDLLNCVLYTLSWKHIGKDNVLRSALNLTEDTIGNTTVGEILRRYVLFEYDRSYLDLSWFDVSDPKAPLMKDVGNKTLSDFERVNIQYPPIQQVKNMQGQELNSFLNNLMPLYGILIRPFIRDKDGKPVADTGSYAHELLYYIYYLLAYATNKGQGPGGWIDFLMGLNMFFVSLYIEAPYSNPVLYYTPSPAEDKQTYELQFTVNDQYYSVRSDSMLVTVVGDSSKTYIFPTVLPISEGAKNVKKLDEEGSFFVPTCMLLPLNTIYDELWSAAQPASGTGTKSRLDPSTEYVYTPSLLWVVSRSFSSQSDVDSSNVSEAVSNRTTNPLLNMLLNYTNRFEAEALPINPGVITMDDGTRAFYVREGNIADTTLACVVDPSDTVVATVGTLGFDEEDGSMIMQYFRDETDPGTLVSKSVEEFQVTEHNPMEKSEVQWAPPTEFLHIPPYEDLGIHAKSYMRAVNQRLCKLNALDYAEELERVRSIISKDLSFVVPAFKMDALLATKAIEDYETYVKQEGFLEDTNMESLRELSKIVLGKNASPIANIDRWNDSCMAVFDAIREATDNDVKYVERIIDMYDVNVIALQGLAISSTTNLIDLECYMAMHCIPSIHRRLRDLEERMLTLRILNEIGRDIEPILRRASPLLTAYGKVTTSANIDEVENSLKSGMTGGKRLEAMPLTRKVLASEVGGSTPILKYFALCKNIYGIMSTAISSEDAQERELYDSLCNCLGLNADGMPAVTQLDEETFVKAPFAITIDEACELNRDKLIALVERGILADTSARVDIHIIKAFDLLVTYGHLLFGIELGGPECENFDDTAEYLNSFYTYVGSFVISYCLVTGDSLAEVEGSRNRIEAFRNDCTGFANYENLLPLTSLELDTDLRGQWGD